MSTREIDAMVVRLEKHIEVTFDRMKSEVVRWLLIAMIYSVAMQAAVTAIVNAFQHH